jgi:hypothetical protein
VRTVASKATLCIATAARSPRLVPLLDCRRSRRVPVVEAQETAQPFATSDSTLPRRNLEIASNQGIPQPLMVPLVMVVSRVFRDGRSQMSLSQRYDPVKALTLNRKHKSLCESVQIRTVCGR